MQPQEEEFPMVKCNDPDEYADLRKIVKYIPHLQSLLADKRHFLSLQDANGLIIRSSTEQNIHKAIKYGIWTTILSNLELMKGLGQEFVEKGKQTFLFFGVSKSNFFLGVARLVSAFNDKGKFNYWLRNNKNQFDGYFKLEWLFVKDVNIKKFKQLKDSQGTTSVDKCRDCSQLTWETTREMLKIYCQTRFKKSIFQDFDHYDRNEETQLRNAVIKDNRFLIPPNKVDKQKIMSSMPMPMPIPSPFPGMSGGMPGSLPGLGMMGGIPGSLMGTIPGGIMGGIPGVMGSELGGGMMPIPMKPTIFTQNPIHNKKKQDTK